MNHAQLWRAAASVLAMFLLLLQAPSAAAAQPQPLRSIQSLAENWKFVQDDSLSDEQALRSSGENWKTVSLPHTWNALDAASVNVTKPYKRGIGWYRLEFETPASGARHWLEFGAASIVSDVWLNGKKLGEHKGAFTAFRFDITDHLAKNERNVLLVKVDNSEPTAKDGRTAIIPLSGDYNMSGGLYRYVWLVSTPHPAHIDLDDLGASGVYASTRFIQGDRAVVNVRTKLKNDGKDEGRYVVRVSLQEKDGEREHRSERQVSLQPGARLEVEQDLEVASPRLWQGVEDPYLYRLVVELAAAGAAPVDRVVQDFGIRQMHFDPDRGFFLNGRHVRLRGVAIHQDYLYKGWATTADEMEESMALVKEIGANAVRFGHYPFDPYYYALADRMGFVVWSEVPVSLGMTTEVLVSAGPTQSGPTCPRLDPTAEYVANARLQLQEIVRQQYNHASVGMWSVANEITFMHKDCEEVWHDNITPALRELHMLAKREDPTRPTTLADFTGEIEQPLEKGYIPVGGNTDLWAINQYFLWYGGPVAGLRDLLNTLKARYPDQPIGVSEYGAGAALTHHTDNVRGGPPEVVNTGVPVVYQPEEYASWVHEQNYAMLESRKYLWGTFVWNLFDFGSGLRNEGDMRGVNTKGLVSFDRRTRKDPFFFYKANWSREPVTYITGRRYVQRAYAVTDVKVYSNADSIELTLNGKPVGTMRREQCPMATCVFRNVRLSPGENRVQAVGVHDGKRVTDTVEWSFDNKGVHIAAGQIATGFRSDSGERFGSDHFFIGGDAGWLIPKNYSPATDTTPVRGTQAQDIFKNYRRGSFSYEIPLADGSYQVTLGFIEPNRNTAVGNRLFDVLANGEKKIENLDVLASAGTYRTVVIRSFTATADNGRLKLDFVPVRGEAVVSNISIVEASAAAGRTAPARADESRPAEIRAKQLIGKAVENRQRVEIGRLDDLLIDPESGRVDSALLRMTNPPSAEGKLLVFAPRDFDIRPGDDLLVLDVDIHVLRRMQALQTSAGSGFDPRAQRASDLIGGKLDDLVVDLRNGSVTGIAVKDGQETQQPLKR